MASRSWNRVELIGNLTRDPELRYTPNGAAVCTFGIATNRTYVTEGEKKEEVDFHRLVSWNKLAELCNQLLKKGNRVFISGRLQTRSWEGQDGQTRQVTEVVIEDMILLTPKGNGEAYVGEEVSVASEVPSRASSDMPSSTDSSTKPTADDVKEEPEKKAEASEDKPADEEKPKPQAPKEDVADEDLPF